MHQADVVARVVMEVLGDAVLGVYLHGSAVHGGLHPRSDIDVLVVTRRPTTDGEKEALISSLLPISGRGDASGRSRSIELTVVVQRDVRPWHYPPPMDLQYGDWWRAAFERGEHPWESPNPDLAVLLTVVLRTGRPIVGPPPKELLDPVPVADLRRSLLDSIPGLRADLEGDEANVVLTFARMWLTMATGAIQPKDAAADWALARLPSDQREVLVRAKEVYLGQGPDDWVDLREQVASHVDHVRARIERLGRARIERLGRARG